MVYAAATGASSKGNITKKWVPDPSHEQTKAQFHSGLGFDGTALSNRFKKKDTKPLGLEILVDRLHQNHFVELVELADSLGMTEAVETLLTTTSQANLSPFLEALVETLKKTVNDKTNALIQAQFEGLFDTLTANGFALDREAFLSLMEASKREVFGQLSVSVCAMGNTNFDTDDKLYLSLYSSDIDFHALSEVDCPLARSVLQAIKKHDHHALLLSEMASMCYLQPDLSSLYEALEPYFGKEETQDPEALLNKILDEDEGDLFYWVSEEEENREEAMGELLPMMVDIISAYDDEQEPVAPTFLSEWFEAQVRPLPDGAIERWSHDLPVHVVSDMTAMMQTVSSGNVYEQEIEDSLLFLKPSEAVETLVAININRQLFNLYDMLSFVGYESELRRDLREAHGVVQTATPVFNSAPR